MDSGRTDRPPWPARIGLQLIPATAGIQREVFGRRPTSYRAFRLPVLKVETLREILLARIRLEALACGVRADHLGTPMDRDRHAAILAALRASDPIGMAAALRDHIADGLEPVCE